MGDVDALVIGGGAAGLVAARDLAQVGRSVTLVEARPRLGGRMHSFADDAYPIPVELGAEFVHGRPDSTFDLLADLGLVAYDCAEEHWRKADGRLRKLDEYGERIEPVARLMAEHFEGDAADMPLSAFLRDVAGPRVPSEAVEAARAFFTGFDAVDPDDASAAALAGSLGDLQDEPQFRVLGGYAAVTDGLEKTLREAGVRVVTDARVTTLRWRPGHVEADLDGDETVAARAAVVTIPAVLLRDDAALRFEPPIPAKRDAAQNIGAGLVVKAVLRFDAAFWERRFPTASMWHDADAAWPTWWTYLPLRAPVLSAWAAGPAAGALSGKSQDELIDSALQSLAGLFDRPRDEIDARFVTGRALDWPADPLARNGYSYVKAGGRDARAALAEPVENTLFFAGEATDVSGYASTVAGALASGRRAAGEVLGQPRHDVP